MDKSALRIVLRGRVAGVSGGVVWGGGGSVVVWGGGGSVVPTRLIKGYRGQRGQRERGRAVCPLCFVSIQATEMSFR